MPEFPRWSTWLECSFHENGDVAFPTLYCPDGHRIPWDYVFHEAGYPRCKHRGGTGPHGESAGTPGRECGKRLFIFYIPRLGERSTPMVWAAEVTHAEIQDFIKRHLDVPAILRELNRIQPPATG